MDQITTMQHDSLRLDADAVDARPRITAAVDALLAAGEHAPRLRAVLDGPRLPSDTIAALIQGLRRLRERGGAIEVTAASAPVRDALVLTGLDRVFAFPIVPEDEPPPRRRNRVVRLVRGTAAAFGAVLVLAALPAVAQAPTTEPSALLAKVIERNPSLSSYQGRMHVDFKMTGFPFFRQHLDATTYYKRPSNYEVVFDRVPAYAKGFEKIFADVGDPSKWAQRFTITYDGQAEFRGRKDARLKMVQKVRGMIDHETVLIDPAGGTIDQISYDYYNGGHITMSQTFSNVGGYTMLASQDADIALPHVPHTVAHGDYADYKTNVAVDDAVFSKKN
jgi:hypothetical protein